MTDAVLVAVIVSVPATLAAVASFINGRKITKVEKDVNEIHLSINSRMTELLNVTRAASKAEGVKEQKDAGLLPARNGVED